MARELVWAKVPGWNWWPAVVLPAPEHGRETRGTRSTKKDDANERIVLFLVDNTVARVPSSLPAFTQHYTRFLSATYANKKLFQAVEEARGLAYEDVLTGGPHEASHRQQLIAYPPPVRDDFKKTSKQLLHWLKGAALDPLGQYNKLSDQANKRVLHAVHNNRLVIKDAKPFVLAPEPAPAAANVSAAAPARLSSRQTTFVADAATDQLPAKRQRKPQAWLQMYGDLPDALRVNNSTPAGQQPAAAGRTTAAGAGPGGGAAPHKAVIGRSSSLPGSKAGCQPGRLKQQHMVTQHGTAHKGLQHAQAVLHAGAAQQGRKRTHTAACGSESAGDSDSEQENEDHSLLSCSDSDDDQPLQQRQHSRGLGLGMAKKANANAHPSQQLQHRSKKRRMMDLLSGSTPDASAANTAAAAAAAVAAAFRAVPHVAAGPATGSSSIDQLLGRKGQSGSRGSGSRNHGRKQQQLAHAESDSDTDADQAGCHSQESDSDELSDAQRQVDSRLRWRHQARGANMYRSSSMQRPRHGLVSTGGGGGGVDFRCCSPQLLRLDTRPTPLQMPELSLGADGRPGLGVEHCCSCCCHCHQQGQHPWQQQHSTSAMQWQQQQQQHGGQQQAPADWLAEDPQVFDAAAADADITGYPAKHLPCIQIEAGMHPQQQQQPVADVEGHTSLVDVQALTDQGLLSRFQEDTLTSPSSILTTVGAPLCPTAIRPAAAVSSSQACSISMLRPPSPLLGAAPVVAVGAELLPGLEEDLQHAAAMFGNSSDNEGSYSQQQQQQQDGAVRCKQHSAAGQPEPTAAGEGYMSDGASAAAATGAEETCVGPLDLEPTLSQGDGGGLATAAGIGGLHPESPSTGSHADLHMMPDWELDIIRSGPQDSELQAEIAAAAAATSAATTAARAAIQIPAVFGYKGNALHRSASSACEDVRRLALARSSSSNRTPDLQNQLQDCKEQLHASTEIVRQLKQQLEAKDEHIAALNSQTSAQAKQLQQQAGELMALRALLGKQQKQAAGAVATPAASTAPGSAIPSKDVCQVAEGAPANASVEAAIAPAAAAAATVNQAATPAEAATETASEEKPAPQPTRRSCRLSAATKAAAKDSVSSAFPLAAAEAEAVADQQSCEKQCIDGVTYMADMRQQLTDAKLMITALEEQLQDVRRQTSAIAQQQQAEASQLRGWLQAAEIDAALMRNENELLKKALPSTVAAQVAATARKPAGKAAGGKAAAGKAETGKAGGSKRASGGRGISAMKALLASQKAAEAASNQGAGTPPAGGDHSMAAVAGGDASDSQQKTGQARTAAATVLATSRAADVFSRQPKLQMPLQAIALPATGTANPQTLAAALTALREAAAAGAGCSTSSNGTATVQAMPYVNVPGTSSASAAVVTAAPPHSRPAYIQLAPAGAGSSVSGPMLVLRPTAGMPLATVLQLNAALSQLAANAAAGKRAQAGTAAVLKSAGTVTAGNASAPAATAATGQPSAGVAKPGPCSSGDKPTATPVLVLNAPQCATVKGSSEMSKAAATALAQSAVTAPSAAKPPAGKEAVVTAVVPPKALAKQGLNLNDV